MTNSDTLTDLYKTDKDYFVKIALKYLKNKTNAECAVNDVFCKIITIESSKAFSSIEAKRWVTCCIKNHCLDLLKVEKNRQRILRENIATPTYAESFEDFSYKLNKKQLRILVRKLSGKRKTAVILYYFFGFKHKEIAKVLKVETNRVGVELSRALKDLNQLILLTESSIIQSK